MQLQRANSLYLDSILGQPHQVHQHGFVRVIDYMGNDESIVEAARVSYGEGTTAKRDSRGLIRYLLSHMHTTPFEMCEIKLHVKLPVFAARQWIRHRTANVNEYSARYSILDREFYIPTDDYMAEQSTSNKQGRAQLLSPDDAAEVRAILIEDAANAYENYRHMTDDTAAGGYGLARELARMNLPTNIYTQWYWKTDLHNLLHFLKLRGDPHAQREIQDYAHVMSDIVDRWVPNAFGAWVDYSRDAYRLNRMEVETLKRLIAHADHTYGALAMGDMRGMGATDRETKKFIETFFPSV